MGRVVGGLWVLALLVLGACGDDDETRSCVSGDECGDAAECIDGVCVARIRPDASDDTSDDASAGDAQVDTSTDGAMTDAGMTDECDGLDGDGDGEVDEDCGCSPPAEQDCFRGDPMTIGVGVCVQGRQACVADGEFGSFGPCEGEVVAGDEVCGTELDEDCDGVVDEECGCGIGEARECYPFPGGRDVGACVAGTEICVDVGDGVGAFGECAGAVGPADEVCGTDADEDCDGVIDEMCGCAVGETRECYPFPGGRDVGVCVAGMEICVDVGDGVGAFGDCTGAVGPADEACATGGDEDCDGVIDEMCGCGIGETRVCYPFPTGRGAGECRDGAETCVDIGAGVGEFGSCTGATGPRAEVCRTGRDEDCDSRVDEGCGCAIGTTRPCYPFPTGRGIGVCRDGVDRCVDIGAGVGGFTGCMGAVGPGAEAAPAVRCDDRDNDCDRAIDEGLCCGGVGNNVLIVLDRTLSMHRLPDGAEPRDVAHANTSSKWAIAVNAVNAMVRADPAIRFGLELFPRDPGPLDGVERCRRLRGVVRDLEVTNPPCQRGEEVIAPSAGNAAVFARDLTVTETRLCNTTPIAEGLVTTRTILRRHRIAGRPDYAVLVTDGRSSRACDPDTVSLERIDALRADGVRTYIVGFDGTGAGIDRSFLNNAACAGGTSRAGGCAGTRAAAPASGTLFYLARTELATTLSAIRGDICSR